MIDVPKDDRLDLHAEEPHRPAPRDSSCHSPCRNLALRQAALALAATLHTEWRRTSAAQVLDLVLITHEVHDRRPSRENHVRHVVNFFGLLPGRVPQPPTPGVIGTSGPLPPTSSFPRPRPRSRHRGSSGWPWYAARIVALVSPPSPHLSIFPRKQATLMSARGTRLGFGGHEILYVLVREKEPLGARQGAPR